MKGEVRLIVKGHDKVKVWLRTDKGMVAKTYTLEEFEKIKDKVKVGRVVRL